MNVLSTIAGLVGGGLNPIFGLLTSTMQSGFKAAIQFHKEGIAFARDVGLSAKQAQVYTNVLIERTQVLANKYGVSADAIMQVQRGLSEATSKQLMLNNAQAESIVQIDKLVGAQTRVKFQEEIMNGMGGQIDTANKALANVYATAAKQGLVAKKLSDKVAQNLSMANRLSFRNGIDGITKMAALSEKLGFKMQSVETAASKFLDLDKAIENAAHMQMLGGSAAAMFGNPLTAAYEANYDPEAFAKRMTDSLASYATFDKTKGIANINGMNMDFVRQIGEQLGIGAEEAARIAKKQAEVQYKETALGGVLNRVAGGDEAKRNYILNNSQVTDNGRGLQINGKDVNSITNKEWAEMLHFDRMSDTQILREQAMKLTSIDEHISGAAATVAASFAKGIDDYLPDIAQKIKEFADIFSVYAEQWGKDTGEAIGKAMRWINTHGDLIKTTIEGILSGITSTYRFLADNWKELLIAIGSWKTFGMMNSAKGGAGAAASAASGAAGGANAANSAQGSNGGGGASPRGGGGGPRGGPTITAGTENGRSYEAFHDNGSKYRRYSDGRIEEELKGKKGKKQWKEVSPNRKATLEQTYQQKVAANPTNATSANGANGATTASNSAKVSRGAKALKGAKGALKGTVPIATLLSAIEMGASIWNYYDSLEDLLNDPNYSNEEKKELIRAARKNRNNTIGSSSGGLVGSIAGAAGAGAILGSVLPGAGNLVGAIVGVVGGTLGYYLGSGLGEKISDAIFDPSEVSDEELNKLLDDYLEGKKPTKEKHAEGGIVGGNSYNGDKIITGLNSGEMVLNKTQQANLFGLLNQQPKISAKPVGEKEYIYVPNRSETSNVNGNTITVKDFNINLSGTLKLDGGNNSKNIDVNALLNDRQFINNLKELIKTSINNDMNGGRLMNDIATMRGHASSLSVIGK